MKPATSNLASRWGLPRPIIKSYAKEKWACPWARGAPQNLGSPLIFLQRLKIATSRLTGRWALPRVITKSHPEEKVGVIMG